MYKLLVKVLFLSVLLPAFALAAKPIVPQPSEVEALGVMAVSANEAKKLYDGGALFVDTRKKVEFAKEHIKGAKSIIYREKGGNKNRLLAWDDSKDKFNTSKLGTNKQQNLIFYCNGERCWRSFKAAVVSKKEGFANVYWLRDGIPAWKQNGYPVE